MKFFKRFKKSLPYTWYIYLLALIVPAIVFPFSYSFMHRAKQYETLSIFVSANLKDEKAEENLLNIFKDSGVRKTEYICSDPKDGEYGFSQKLSVVGYNRCDILIIPEDKLSKVGIWTATIELTDFVKEKCNITSEKIYEYDGVAYGVELPKTGPLNEIINYDDDTNYYAFINYKSLNIGELSQKSPYTENAFKLMSYYLGK